MATNRDPTSCFDDADCALIRQKLANYVHIDQSAVLCTSDLTDDLGFPPGAKPGLAPMVNAIRKLRGLPPLPMATVAKSKTVSDLCKLLKK
jgi:hypothetical protein